LVCFRSDSVHIGTSVKRFPELEIKIQKIIPALDAKPRTSNPTTLTNPHTLFKMGKDKSEKKEKKEKRSEKDGVKKSKKDRKSKLSDENLAAAFEEATKEVEKPVVETQALSVKASSGEVVVKPVGALVPFANPLADDKVTKKVLKSVKKGMAAASRFRLGNRS
jgi:hypothetical protein